MSKALNTESITYDEFKEAWVSNCYSFLMTVVENGAESLLEITGHADIEDYLLNGLEMDPEMVRCAIECVAFIEALKAQNVESQL
jgi:hypothetical protein